MIRVKRMMVFILIILTGLLFTGPILTGATGSGLYAADHSTVDGTSFAGTVDEDGVQLYLSGTALLRYMLFIKAYAGAFYLPRGKSGDQALSDIPKYLVLEYRVGISAEDFAKATSQKIRDSVSSEEYERLRPDIDRFNRLYRDVNAGDRYALGYIPGRGTRLIYNTTPLGMIEGYEFSRAVFSIWLGDNPIDTSFRDRLLGKRQ